MSYFISSTFVRSGNINLNYGSARNLGINGNGWSGVAAGYAGPTSGSTKAYNLNFNASGVNPSNGPWERWNGRPVRPLLCRGSVPIFITSILCLRAGNQK